jgi:hypothetical protein
MKWLTKLFTVEKIDVTPPDFSHRVAEIQSRIAALRRRIERAEKYPNKSQPVTEPKTIDDARAKKAAELNDIKAKLLGKKT